MTFFLSAQLYESDKNIMIHGIPRWLMFTIRTKLCCGLYTIITGLYPGKRDYCCGSKHI